jgi:hypothetical protein
MGQYGYIRNANQRVEQEDGRVDTAYSAQPASLEEILRHMAVIRGEQVRLGLLARRRIARFAGRRSVPVAPAGPGYRLIEQILTRDD